MASQARINGGFFSFCLPPGLLEDEKLLYHKKTLPITLWYMSRWSANIDQFRLLLVNTIPHFWNFSYYISNKLILFFNSFLSDWEFDWVPRLPFSRKSQKFEKNIWKAPSLRLWVHCIFSEHVGQISTALDELCYKIWRLTSIRIRYRKPSVIDYIWKKPWTKTS